MLVVCAASAATESAAGREGGFRPRRQPSRLDSIRPSRGMEAGRTTMSAERRHSMVPQRLRVMAVAFAATPKRRNSPRIRQERRRRWFNVTAAAWDHRSRKDGRGDARQRQRAALPCRGYRRTAKGKYVLSIVCRFALHAEVEALPRCGRLPLGHRCRGLQPLGGNRLRWPGPGGRALHLAIPRAVRARRVGAAIAAYLFMCCTNEGSGQRGVNR